MGDIKQRVDEMVENHQQRAYAFEFFHPITDEKIIQIGRLEKSSVMVNLIQSTQNTIEVLKSINRSDNEWETPMYIIDTMLEQTEILNELKSRL